MGRSFHAHSVAWDIMRAIGYGAVAASLFIAPNIGVALAPFLRDSPSARRAWNRRRVQEALRRLRERRYVRFEQRGNETFIVVTEFGRRRLRQFEFHAVVMPEPPQRWDKRWRVVIFDIPEKHRRARMVFRNKLAALGFLPLQRSVFAYPYPCMDEVDFLAHFLDVERHVHCMQADSLGTAEGRARRHFDLLR